MAQLKITRASGEVTTHKISPAIEFAFEAQFNAGIHRRFRDEERQSDIYWLAWKCLSVSGAQVEMFGEKFVGTLISVEVLDDDSPNE
jgi:hypothetical protein